MIERHTCYYRVNNDDLYRDIYNAVNFEQDMKDIGIVKRSITILSDGEYKGVFEIDPETHTNRGFKYFEDRGIFFSMTRPCKVSPVEAHKEMLQELKSIKSRLQQVA